MILLVFSIFTWNDLVHQFIFNFEIFRFLESRDDALQTRCSTKSIFQKLGSKGFFLNENFKAFYGILKNSNI